MGIPDTLKGMKKSTAFLLATTCTASLLVATPAAATDGAPISEERCVALSDAATDATADYASAQNRERAAKQALTKAENRVAAAERAQKDSANLVDKAQRAVAKARAELAEKKAALPAGGITYAAAKQAVERAQHDVNDARAALDASKAEAQRQFDRGSFGFFETMGARDAVAEFNTNYRFEKVDPITGRTGYRIADDTNIGDPKDATHLDNMKAAIEFLPEGNRLRMSDGQSALPVSDFLMAQAQVNLNWSRYPRGHSGNGLDNLSWGSNNPYEGWFHKERPKYFDAVAKGQDPFAAGAGHYMAIVNPDTVATGFAVSQYPSRLGGYTMTISHAQTFAPKWEPQGKTYSVAEYTQRFNRYYDGLKEAVANGDATKRRALQQRESQLAQAQRTLDAAQTLHQAEQLVQQREQELSQARAEQASRQRKAQEELAAAQRQQAEATEALNTAESAVAAAQVRADQARADYAPYKQDCEKSDGSSNDGSSDGSSSDAGKTGGIIAGVLAAILALLGLTSVLNVQFSFTTF